MKCNALVTGASSGIGEEFARVCAEHGHDLILVARSNDKLQALKQRLEKELQVTAHVIPYDLSKPKAAEEIFQKLKQQNIPVDILVNNAGFGDFGSFVDADWDKLNDMIQVNITSLTHLTKLFLPGMVERKRGRILNIASTAAFGPGPMMAVYYATKGYVLQLSEALAKELQGTGVTVTVVCPGPTETGFQAAAGSRQSKLVQGKKLPTARDVALYSFEAMYKGTTVAVHGLMNNLLVQTTRFLPRKSVADLVYKIQETKR